MSYIGLAPGVSSQRMEDTFTATAGQTSFVPSSGYVPGNIDVYRNGVKLANGLEFTASNGITVVLNNACAAGDSVVLLSYIPRGLSDGYLKSESDAKFLTALNPNYTGTLTGGTGVINIGSGQVYKDASGNVGIGTSSPGAKLHVSGGDIQVSAGSSLKYSATAYITPEDNVQGARISAPGIVSIWTGATPVERARIDSSGRICIADPNANFGRLNISNAYGSLSSNIMVWLNTNTTASRYLSFEYNGNGGSGSITPNGTNAVSYNTSSDYRLKEAIVPMTGALAKNELLNPVTYKWKSDGSDGQGFIAHELQAVFPDAVTGEKDAVRTVEIKDEDGNVIGTKEEPVYQGVDTSFLVGHLVACIKELKAELDAVKAQLQGAMNG